MPRIQLIAVDLDGTLLNSQHQLSEPTILVLRQAIAQGVQVVIATGKTLLSAAEAYRRLNLTTPGVFLQGLIVYNADGSIRHQQTLAPELVREIAAYARTKGVSLVAYSGIDIFTEKRTDQTDKLLKFHEPTPQEIPSLDALQAERAMNKLIIIEEPARTAAVRAELSQTYAGRATFVQALPDMLEILPPGASKGAGLRWLLDDLGIAPEHVMALGDGENDIEMLKIAGIGVAMGNAGPQVKAAADAVVASNDADGVAEAVRRFVLDL
jgi:Cof subfamily protein (haloacid dehalogenase superfamily)